MDLATATAIEGLAIQGLQTGVKLYNELRAKNPALPPVSEILAEADAIADKVVDKANAEIAEAENNADGGTRPTRPSRT